MGDRDRDRDMGDWDLDIGDCGLDLLRFPRGWGVEARPLTAMNWVLTFNIPRGVAFLSKLSSTRLTNIIMVGIS